MRLPFPVLGARGFRSFLRGLGCVLALAVVLGFAGAAVLGAEPAVRPAAFHATAEPFPRLAGAPGAAELLRQSADDVQAKSVGCVRCHVGARDMHDSPTVKLGCVDCHGGDPNCPTKEGAHVAPRFPAAWSTSANPIRSYTLLNHESPEFIRFVNPGDLRVAHVSCGECHAHEVLAVRKSMMTHGCMLWGAALYNNGIVPNKRARFGESYSMHGAPQRVQTVWRGGDRAQQERDLAVRGVLPFLDPLPRFEVSQPGNTLRIFEAGGRFRPEIGIPERGEEPGRPRARLSNRGPGTENRTDPVFIGLQKTRLLDPTLNFLGTNDHPGDYRSSGCSACHVVYANDRSPVHSGRYARYGHQGLAAAEPDGDFVLTVDPTIPKHERGHPITHRFTTAIPTSQCIVCHIHPGTTVLNTYLGFMWWDNETDGELMYPRRQRYPTNEEWTRSQMSNPEEAAVRGLWSDPDFLDHVSELNPAARHTQFADFHGHGWVFSAVFKRDRQGKLLDYRGLPVSEGGSEQLVAAVQPPSAAEAAEGKRREDTPVHLMDIHLERGMHCVDCHFYQDSHGDTKLYGEVRAAIEISCVDCHGTAAESIPERLARDKTRRLPTSGPASQAQRSPLTSTDLLTLRTPFKRPRFEVVTGADGRRRLIQRSMVEPRVEWEVVQTADTITPGNPRYNARSHQAKTIRWSGEGELLWGGRPAADETIDGRRCAHQNSNMSCITCHSSWNASCFGCHLPQRANRKAPNLHNEGEVSRNLTSYNFQTLRHDVFMLGRDGTATGNKINPARSSCAVHVTSYNQNRETIYTQQQTICGGGLSGIAFSTNVPHTVRGGNGAYARRIAGAYDEHEPGTHETKSCTDCHLSQRNDNNAVMAQLLMHGTNYVNFIGRYAWVAAGEHGLQAVVVTEQQEPQAVIGSTLHRLAYPDDYRKHQEREGQLEHAHEHPGRDILDGLMRPLRKPEILSLQARGEYLYAACGTGGLRVFDIAFIDHKGFAERITTAPVSPAGQKFYVPTRYATAVAAPTTIAPDPTRQQFPENDEAPVHLMYAFLYVTDKYEGLILVGAGTLLDGNPLNNFLKRDLTYNPDGILNGARSISFAGTYAYICCDAGLVVVSLANPLKPEVTAVLGPDQLKLPRNVQVQFRYGFVCDEEGLQVLDVTDLAHPRVVPGARVELPDARSVYVARTYAYVAGGEQGLVIVDVTNPEQPRLDQIYDAGGCLNDTHDVKLGITNASEFAYVADGENGMRVVQLTSAETPGNPGFSPQPTPQLIATFSIPKGGHALAIAKGIDRDRAIDESGNQLAVFGRVGARPLSLAEQQRMYLRVDALHGERRGQTWQVSDNPFAPIYRRSPDVPLPPKNPLGPQVSRRLSDR